MASAEVVGLLKQTPLFMEFTEKELQALLTTSKEREFEAGTTIVREGDLGNLGFYLVTDGQVEVKKGEKLLTKLGVGGFFGEMALMDEAPRSADVIAVDKTTVTMLTRWDLKAIISTHPDIALKMMSELTRRLRETNRALSE
jgi:CRP/FNR family transcriptional regulator/CRP/FNR family cyclic AMP-dependent transcriptional regulator